MCGYVHVSVQMCMYKAQSSNNCQGPIRSVLRIYAQASWGLQIPAVPWFVGMERDGIH